MPSHGAAAVRRRWRVRFPSKHQLRLNTAGTGGTSTGDSLTNVVTEPSLQRVQDV